MIWMPPRLVRTVSPSRTLFATPIDKRQPGGNHEGYPNQEQHQWIPAPANRSQEISAGEKTRNSSQEHQAQVSEMNLLGGEKERRGDQLDDRREDQGGTHGFYPGNPARQDKHRSGEAASTYSG